MKIAVLGTGYVGLVSGVCFASLGVDVSCYDKNSNIINSLKNGQIHIHENGLQELLYKVQSLGKIAFYDTVVNFDEYDAIVIAVGTPASQDGSADLSHLMAAVEEIALNSKRSKFIIIKSTVPIGTAKIVNQRLGELNSNVIFSVISNPEFLREGSAVKDFLEPDRIVVGTSSKDAESFARRLYSAYLQKDVPIFFTDNSSAELIKYAANCFLATRIAFINEMADIAEKVGANIDDVAEGMGLDSRIGRHYLHAGPGFGGSCFPKDTQALLYSSQKLNVKSKIVEAVIESNEQRKIKLVDKVLASLNQDAKGKKIAVLGVTFKANTDDMRDAASLVLLPSLKELGASVSIYDPSNSKQAHASFEGFAHFAASVESCLADADVVVILTEWPEFRILDLNALGKLMKSRVMVDYRNLFVPSEMADMGFKYYSVGR